MNLDETDIEEARRNGAKVRGERGASLRTILPPKAAVSPEAAMLTVLRDMTRAIETAISKRGESPAINLRPEITVTPTIAAEPVAPPRSWKIEVTERDADKRIKSMTIKAAD